MLGTWATASFAYDRSTSVENGHGTRRKAYKGNCNTTTQSAQINRSMVILYAQRLEGGGKTSFKGPRVGGLARVVLALILVPSTP